jgi:hypothetical protein
MLKIKKVKTEVTRYVRDDRTGSLVNYCSVVDGNFRFQLGAGENDGTLEKNGRTKKNIHLNLSIEEVVELRDWLTEICVEYDDEINYLNGHPGMAVNP